MICDEWLADLAGAGLFGVGVDHPDHDDGARDRLRSLGTDLALATTGASGDHGRLTGHRLGCETTSPEVYERLIAEAAGATPITGAGA